MVDYVFLGGTCNGSNWRDELIAKLRVTYFNPIRPKGTWSSHDEAVENSHKETCKYALYVITPKMSGVYSIAEAVDSSHRKPGKTIFCILAEDDGMKFTDAQWKSLMATERLLQSNSAIIRRSLDDVAELLNTSF